MESTQIYTLDGSLVRDPTLLFESNAFFRKITSGTRENEICELLMKHPHKNIVKIYDVQPEHIDMELLTTNLETQDNNPPQAPDYLRVSTSGDSVNTLKSTVKNIMHDVKTYLQQLGIMYIDWKMDNIGISDDGHIKLFDFDVSGLLNVETHEWTIAPLEYWSYNQAIQHGMKTPADIDDYAFEIGFE